MGENVLAGRCARSRVRLSLDDRPGRARPGRVRGRPGGGPRACSPRWACSRGTRIGTARTLPFGSQRIVEIARALGRPAAVAPARRAGGRAERRPRPRRWSDLLRGLVARGITILLIEHNMTLVQAVADAVVVVHHQPEARGRANPFTSCSRIRSSSTPISGRRCAPAGGGRPVLHVDDLVGGLWRHLRPARRRASPWSAGELVSVDRRERRGQDLDVVGHSPAWCGRHRVESCSDGPGCHRDEAGHRLVKLGVSHVPEGRKMLAPLTVEENLLLGGFLHAAMTAPRCRRRSLRRDLRIFPILSVSAGTSRRAC